MLKIIENLKSLVATTDFFYSTKLLRYDEENQYKTFTGGAISLAIIITIVLGFANMILNTLNLNTFTISTQIIKNSVPTPSDVRIDDGSPFRMAFEIWRHNFSDTRRYFDVTLLLNYQQYGNTTNITSYPLQACTKEYFKDYPEITNNFDTLQAGGWLCLPLNTTLSLEGKYSSASYRQYIVNVSACKNQTEPGRLCATQDQITKYFTDHKNSFYFTAYFSNTQINPDKKDYKKYYIADQNYAMFGSSIGSETFLYLSDYTVYTDSSIWPFSKVQTDSGCYAQELAINHPYQTSIDGVFITFNIVKSLNSVVYSRQVQKLSAVFSFIGGMIGAVSAVLFVVKAYTNLSYEFSMAFAIFKQNILPKPVKLKPSQNATDKTQLPDPGQQQSRTLIEMNICNFIKYYIYLFLEGFACKFDQPQMKYAKECKDEILRQLDVKCLIQRIIFLQHCITYLIDDYQLHALQLQRPQNLQQIRYNRLKFKSIVDVQLLSDCEFLSQQQIKQKAKSEKVMKQADVNFYDESPQQFRRARALATVRKQKKKQCQSIGSNNQGFMEFPKTDEINECIENSENAFNAINKKEGNKIKDISKRMRLKELYMNQLQKNAMEGNPVSNKIWCSMSKDLKYS